LLQPLHKRCDADPSVRIVRGHARQDADPPYPFRLLRARSERPNSRAAEERYELTPPHLAVPHTLRNREVSTLRPIDEWKMTPDPWSGSMSQLGH
jgi:hypothetical protein